MSESSPILYSTNYKEAIATYQAHFKGDTEKTLKRIPEIIAERDRIQSYVDACTTTDIGMTELEALDEITSLNELIVKFEKQVKAHTELMEKNEKILEIYRNNNPNNNF